MTGRHAEPKSEQKASPVVKNVPPAGVGSPTAKPGFKFDAQRYLRALTNVLLLLVLLFQMTHRPKYEYMTIAPSDSSFDERMNEIGGQGWKTESCRRATSGSDNDPTASYECILSRPKLGW